MSCRTWLAVFGFFFAVVAFEVSADNALTNYLTNLSPNRITSYIAANDDEVKACEDEAAATMKEIESVMKDRPQSCVVKCRFSDGSQSTISSPDGQMCDDFIGVAPTGTCKDGSCKI